MKISSKLRLNSPARGTGGCGSSRSRRCFWESKEETEQLLSNAVSADRILLQYGCSCGIIRPESGESTNLETKGYHGSQELFGERGNIMEEREAEGHKSVRHDRRGFLLSSEEHSRQSRRRGERKKDVS